MTQFDAGAHVGQLCDAPQATDLLANWVRDRGKDEVALDLGPEGLPGHIIAPAKRNREV